MQLLQGHVLQQSAELAVRAGLGHELLNALGQSGALIRLGCLEYLLQDPHALGPHRILRLHTIAQRCTLEFHSDAADCKDSAAP